MIKQRVLFIIWSFTYGGGAEKILANIVNNLNREQYDIEVLEYYHSDIGKEELKENIRILPPIIDSTDKRIISRIRNKIINKLVYICPRTIRKHFLNKKYDVEVSFNYLIPSFLLNRKSTKLISWIHSSIDDLKYDKKNKDRQKKYLSKVDAIVAISNKTQQSITDLFPDFSSKVYKIYNGYDFSKIRFKKMDVEPFDILFCNRLDDNKNPLFFLDVLKYLKDYGLCFSVKILGTGVLSEQLQRKIALYGLEKNVKMMRYIKEPYEYYNACKIFCLTSKAEGFPTTIVESMFFGKPFVTTPVGGVEELSCNGKCGFIENTVESFAMSIVKLLHDATLYEEMSMKCCAEVSKYSLSNQIENIEKILK